ncbi:MAG: NAD(+) synthase [Deltaproteobacteria bacterium]|nr:NAD(+) synthase [Deltaproteobacteria bacterium]
MNAQSHSRGSHDRVRSVRLGAAALNQTPLDWDGNLRRARAAVDEARAAKVSMLCLPELALSGYGCEDLFLSPFLASTAAESLEALLPHTEGMVVAVGLPVHHAGVLFNGVAVIADCALAAVVAKQSLAGDGIHYEPRWFRAWPSRVRDVVRLLGREVPIGDLRMDFGGVTMGFEICEDAWVAKRPGAALALDSVDVIFNPSASHFSFGKREVRRRLVAEGSRAFGVAYVYANLLGNEAGRAIYDGHTLIAAPSLSVMPATGAGESTARTSAGEAVIEGPRFSFREHVLVHAAIDLEEIRARRAATASFTPRLPRDRELFVHAPVNVPEAPREAAISHVSAWEHGPDVKHEEFARAVSLGLFDYLRKSRSQGFVVSLSGGADSAAITSLISWMVRASAAEIGLTGVRARLAHVRDLGTAADEKAIVGRLLTTVYQSTINSGSVTKNAARAVAEAVGAKHHEVDVDALVKGYIALAEGALGRPLAWQTDDIALQNVQARVRSPSAWMLANVEGKLLLATSNRSEAAVGYATMDGDTSGGLSPIAGIDKHYLRSWLRWLETEADVSLRIPALAAVNVQAPTAELRPSDKKQTDEDDLMPYDVLDRIERLTVRDRHAPLETFEILRLERPEIPASRLALWVERFFTLFARNQWKRERYAPSFHLDDESLDPKTFCRLPILSGGFQRELGEMRAALAREGETPR